MDIILLLGQLTTELFLIALIIAVVLLGFTIASIKRYHLAITLAWVMVFLSISLIESSTRNFIPVLRMLAIIMVTLFSMKTVVTVESYKNEEMKLTFKQWLAFVAGWFGMRPKLFETMGQRPLNGGKELVVFGLKRVLFGAVLFTAGRYAYHYCTLYEFKVMSIGVVLVSLSLILHFGILNISAGMWRYSGVNTITLFRSPLQSASLTEFWGKRWNLAFSEMTSIALYRPLRGIIGTSGALLTAFVFSGFLHELAISFPVQSGIGLPMLYFVIHGIAMMIEKFMAQKGFAFAEHRLLGRIWVMIWLIAPLPILFHKEFLKGIILPLLT